MFVKFDKGIESLSSQAAFFFSNIDSPLFLSRKLGNPPSLAHVALPFPNHTLPSAIIVQCICRVPIVCTGYFVIMRMLECLSSTLPFASLHMLLHDSLLSVRWKVKIYLYKMRIEHF